MHPVRISAAQRFYVENRPGNSGSIGSAMVARAEPDGYTLLIGGWGPHLTGPAINPSIGYDPLRDFIHIAMIAGDTYALAANAAVGVRTLDQLIALAREKPLASASPGPGSLRHLLLIQFNRLAKVDIQHIPAPGGTVTNVLGNHVPLALTTVLTVGEYLRSGALVGIAHLNRAQSGVSRRSDLCGARLSRDTRQHLVLADPAARSPARDRRNAQRRGAPRRQIVAGAVLFARQALLTMDLVVAG